ncbi:MAG: hypothetical protein P1U87_22585 [Verrucomicrobiales bacterium]|nr:hypothetical protein [Verrucomicrobiales bacterium]
MASAFQVTPQMRVSVSIPATSWLLDFLPVSTLTTDSDIQKSVESIGLPDYYSENCKDA